MNLLELMATVFSPHNLIQPQIMVCLRALSHRAGMIFRNTWDYSAVVVAFTCFRHEHVD